MTHTLYQDVIQNISSPYPAFYFREHQLSYPKLIQRIDLVASKLAAIGIRKDTVVTLLSPNVPEAVITFYALNKIGAIINILHPLIPENGLITAMKEASSDILLILDLRYSAYEKVISENALNCYFLSADPDLSFIEKAILHMKMKKNYKKIDKNRLISNLKETTDVTLNTDDLKPSVYLRSGGTTSKSKTIVLNDRSLRYPALCAEDILGEKIHEGLSMIGVLPLFHGFGLAMGIHAPMMWGATSALMVSYDEKEIIRKIRQNRINILITVPYMADRLTRNKDFDGSMLKNLVVSFVGADKPEQRIFDDFNALMERNGSSCRLFEGYGLTETVTVNYVNTFQANRKGSVGKGLRDVETRIADSDDPAKEMMTNEDGEILIHTPCPLMEYLNEPEENQPFYIDKDNKSWIRTGDIGHVDKDGFLYFRNRKKDVFKIAGYNVFMSEIEEYALSIREIKEAACIYVDDRKHPYIKLFVSTDSDKNEIKAKLEEVFRKNLLRYSIPEQIEFRDHLPRTSIGKIDKTALK